MKTYDVKLVLQMTVTARDKRELKKLVAQPLSDGFLDLGDAELFIDGKKDGLVSDRLDWELRR